MAGFVEVAPGEVVYAGTFDLGSEAMGPDLSLEPAVAFLQPWPDGAQRLRAAVYTNGVTGPCAGNYLYELDIPGAPYDPAFPWRSESRQATPTPAAADPQTTVSAPSS